MAETAITPAETQDRKFFQSTKNIIDLSLKTICFDETQRHWAQAR